jgi:hypothetical protein
MTLAKVYLKSVSPGPGRLIACVDMAGHWLRQKHSRFLIFGDELGWMPALLVAGRCVTILIRN